MTLPSPKIFEWLGGGSQHVPYYLHPLNLAWSDKGVEHDLKIFRRVASQLAGNMLYWAEIIRDLSWRHSLAGCACLLASGRSDFFEELSYRFQAGSFVAPQLGVALGLLHRANARSVFESVLSNPTLRKNQKQAVSAHRILLRLGVQPAYDISFDNWPEFGRDDAMIADRVVSEHWNFWSQIISPDSPA